VWALSGWRRPHRALSDAHRRDNCRCTTYPPVFGPDGVRHWQHHRTQPGAAPESHWVIHTVAYTVGCLLQVEGEEHEQKYSHIFHLLPEGGSYWVQVRCITSLGAS
jgi:hypothetical protein